MYTVTAIFRAYSDTEVWSNQHMPPRCQSLVIATSGGAPRFHILGVIFPALWLVGLTDELQLLCQQRRSRYKNVAQCLNTSSHIHFGTTRYHSIHKNSINSRISSSKEDTDKYNGHNIRGRDMPRMSFCLSSTLLFQHGVPGTSHPHRPSTRHAR